MKAQITTIPVYQSLIYIRFDVNETWNFQILVLSAGVLTEVHPTRCGAGLLMIATQEMRKFIDQQKRAS